MNTADDFDESASTRDAPRGPEAFGDVQADFSRLLAGLSAYAEAQTLELRQRLLRAALIALAAFSAATIVLLLCATAAVLFVVGGAQAIAVAFDGPLWAGQMLVGVVFFAAAASAVGVFMLIRRWRFARHMKRKITELH